MMEKIIELDSLYFKYKAEDEAYTLENLSFDVYKGEWLSIVGHNGSGKSTTARLIDGLLEAESGQIRIAGQVLTIDNVWDLRRKIGMVFQNPDNQFVGATVEDDVAFGLENRGTHYDEMKTRVHEAIDRVGMAEFKDREPARLSGGQKQRVAMAGLVALRPEILILDEATSMLDPEGRIELMETVRNIKQEFGLTVISITHDLEEVALSDRVLVMKGGQLESSCKPEQLFLREDLASLGLDLPFTGQVLAALGQKGYMDERQLEDYLWELHLNK